MSLFLRYLLVAGPSLLLLVLVVALGIRTLRRRRRHRAAQRARERGDRDGVGDPGERAD